MNRALLVAVVCTASVSARAADPPAGESPADPFATPPDPAPSDPDEEALLRGPTKPTPAAVAPAPVPARPASRSAGRRVAQASDEPRTVAATAAPAEEPGGLALELSTSGFASGTLAGGIFLGGRLASGMGGLILGGTFDYALQSVNLSAGGADVTTAAQQFRLGAGARLTFARSADRRVDLFGAGDVGFEYRSAELPATSGSSPTTSLSAAGFSLALGPGLRIWIHEQIAIGYVARFRLTYLSGDVGVLAPATGADATSGSATTVGFDGTFQILGVF